MSSSSRHVRILHSFCYTRHLPCYSPYYFIVTRLADSGDLPHLLLYGPPGTGKTSTALALAKKINCGNPASTLELNASDDRTIAVVRDKIKSFASTTRIFETGIKWIILDEADAITTEAQATLRRIIEKYSRTTRFCLICNQVDKLSPAIQSRCSRFRFAPLPNNLIRDRLQEIALVESVNVTLSGFDAMLKIGGGDFRRNLNILQSVHMAFPNQPIDEHHVYACMGLSSPKHINLLYKTLVNEDLQACQKMMHTMKADYGYCATDILEQLYHLLNTHNIDDVVRIEMYTQLAEIDHSLSMGASEKLQLSAIIATFMNAQSKFT